jgi:hypothetical protein
VNWKKRQVQPRRVLPVDDELDIPLMTLPIPVHQEGSKWKQHAGRTARVDEVGPSEVIPRAKVEARQVPGALALPVIHSTKPGIFKRAVEVQLANRSDVAYYAQRKFIFSADW